MNILHIITRLIIGGAQENTLLSCEGQHRDGHDVTLITGPPLGPEGSLIDRANSGGYRVIVLDEMRRAIRPLRDYKAFRRLVRLIKELKPDIVHTHSSKAGILGRRAAHAAGNRVIIHTIHGLAFTASKRPIVNAVYKFLERKAAKCSTRIVCVADAMAEQSLAAGIGRREQYVTIYSGMETAPFLKPTVSPLEIRKQLGLSRDDLVVGTLARLFELKGHDDLLDIAPQICERFPKLKFLWIGDGTLRPHLESRMKQMNLRDRFVLTGMMPPTLVPELIGAMDILVHPSRREGLARAIPQAELAGKPVVTYDIDGNREGLENNVGGLVISPFDKKRVADAIVYLAQDAELRIQMGIAGRAFALKRFDAEVMVGKLEGLYEELLKA